MPRAGPRGGGKPRAGQQKRSERDSSASMRAAGGHLMQRVHTAEDEPTRKAERNGIPSEWSKKQSQRPGELDVAGADAVASGVEHDVHTEHEDRRGDAVEEDSEISAKGCVGGERNQAERIQRKDECVGEPVLARVNDAEAQAYRGERDPRGGEHERGEHAGRLAGIARRESALSTTRLRGKVKPCPKALRRV